MDKLLLSKKNFDKIQEVDEEYILSANPKHSDQESSSHPFSFSPSFLSNEEKQSDHQDQEDTFSNNSTNEQRALNPKNKLSSSAEKQQPQHNNPIISQPPVLNMFGIFNRKSNNSAIGKPSGHLEQQKIYDEIIHEDEDDENEGLIPQIPVSDPSKIRTDSNQEVSKLSSLAQRKKERARFQIPMDRLDKYEKMKIEGKIVNFALAHASKKNTISSDNYKSLISNYMKDQEIGKPIASKNENETKMISTEIEQRIKDHITNHKIRANQKYQIVKNFFRIWFINSKEIRRQEKKQSQKTVNDHMVTDKILKAEQENRKKIKFLNEKKPELVTVEAQKSQKSKGQLNGKLYIKPGFDIKQYIPFCTDIYLGKD